MQQKHIRGSHVTIFKELEAQDVDSFKNYMRMTPQVFNVLLGKVEEHIKKEDTVMRSSISPVARLEVTLRFLAAGGSYRALQYSSTISHSSLTQIIPETCTAIYEALRRDYLKVRSPCQL